MSFLPKTKRQKHTLFVLILLMPVIAMEIYFGAEYAAERDNDFRAFLWDTKTLWRLKPGFQGEAFGRPVHVNANGFRAGQETPLESEHEIRIITLGDSRTYGYEVDDKATYSMVMQKRLRDMGIDAEAINAGTHGYSAVQARGKLEESLAYGLDVAVFAPGYNDRRYTVARPPDSMDAFYTIAMTRNVLGVLQWSNTFFAFLQELGKAKLKELHDNPPSLDKVDIRVAPETFENELRRFVGVCRANDIIPVFLLIYADPYVYQDIEKAGALIDAEEYEKAMALMEKLYPTLHNHAHMLYRLYMGRCYQALGELEKAQEQFKMHAPVGSLHGEAVLRRQELYFDKYRNVAKEENILLIDSREKIMARSGEQDESQFFQSCFVDECHYNPVGHQSIGEGLAEEMANLF